jgi:hypothetical protein
MPVEIYELLEEQGCTKMFQKSRSRLKIPVATVQNLVTTATLLPGFGQLCTIAYLNILEYFCNDCISTLVFTLCFRFGIGVVLFWLT